MFVYIYVLWRKWVISWDQGGTKGNKLLLKLFLRYKTSVTFAEVAHYEKSSLLLSVLVTSIISSDEKFIFFFVTSNFLDTIDWFMIVRSQTTKKTAKTNINVSILSTSVTYFVSYKWYRQHLACNAKQKLRDMIKLPSFQVFTFFVYSVSVINLSILFALCNLQKNCVMQLFSSLILTRLAIPFH